jgi:hypothetical protein
VAAPPDPVTPGLLDLLSAAAGGASASDPDLDVGDPAAPPPLGTRRPAPAIAAVSGSRRLWVEIEV